ncbi:MAG TPA: TonB C-terminal domain-containing protein [Blastocatellia bacterium]|nr:TonB C-terminal domain-containing protein [Blastocatellia bacterium]
MLSVVMHVALLGVCAWYFRNPLTTDIIAAGEGQGSGENMIEVGTVDGKTLGFTPYRNVSYKGDEPDKPNNEVVSTEAPKPDPDSEVLPSTKSTPNPKDKLTDRPTANPTALVVSPTPLRGRSTSTSADIGRTIGTPIPSLTQGVGVSSGANLAGASGVPGGSEYGRRLQSILGRNYNPPPTNDAGEAQYVIVQLRIARDGRILSLVNGQIPPNYFKRRSSNGLVNNAVVRAVLAAGNDGLPPFPNGFLMGAQEAIAEVWFRYPK